MTTVQLGGPAVRPGSLDVDVKGLEDALRRSVSGEVRFDAGSRGAYATDASNYRQVPIGVVVPRTTDDVVAAVACCHEFGAPVTSRGAGTSLAGQTCNVAVVIDHSKYLREVLEIDPDRRLVRVQPGAVLDRVRDACEQYGLTVGPDPATHEYCTIGGMIGNNACGTHAQMAGRMADNVEELEVLTYDGTRMRVGATSPAELDRLAAAGGRAGQIHAGLRSVRDRYADLIRARFPDIPRRVSGYALEQLLPEHGGNVARALTGSEGTCVTTLEATCNLVASPAARVLLVLGFPDIAMAADHVPEVVEAGPIACEGLDRLLIGYVENKGMHPRKLALLPDGQAFLLCQFGGDTTEEAEEKAHALTRRLRNSGDPASTKLVSDPAEASGIWAVREAGLAATSRVHGGGQDNWPGWEDSAVPPDRLGDYLRDLRKLFERYGYEASLYGHFGHGCIHSRIPFDLRTAEGISTWRSFLDDAADLVVGYGGSLSGEHGDGQARGELLEKQYGPELVRAFGEFKGVWDPDGRMNPGKVVDPYPITSNLRLGTGYDPRPGPTHFAYPADEHDFSRAALRCVGVGKCRRTEGGVMCPSYMVLEEEEHTTRGRARLLFEMLNGSERDSGWRSEAVHEALDLCLSCKGCKADCPVNVDMATYKAEFLSHHYKGRLRPVAAYSLGLIWLWARAASRFPEAANLLTHAPLVGGLAKRLAGVTPELEAPRFAAEPFTAWFRRRGPRYAPGTGRPRVVLWPDTFNNYFHPGTARAATQVLQDAGFEVVLPRRPVCCGRPLYDHGMLPTAKRLLRHTLDTLRDELRAGTPVVGVEPSCLAVFRDELPNLFPHDQDAQRLAHQSYTLAELLEASAPEWRAPALEAGALVQRHCHHYAIMGFDPDEKLLGQAGLDAEVLDAGCCGMAGSFGFEAGERASVARRAGERGLLPRVREAAAGTVVVADGFSCKTQIEQHTGRRALHLTEVLRLARHGRAGLAAGRRPEEVDAELDAEAAGPPPRRRQAVTALTALAAAGAAATAALRALRGRRAR